jgi:hypothetical protein
MPKAWLCSMLLLLSLACGDDGGGAGPGPTVNVGGDAGGGRNVCVDEDDDGFGRYCDDGPDCDDDDADVTDECVRCAMPNKGCPCTEGTMWMHCRLAEQATMRTTQDGVVGSLVCSEGTRYCRDQVWTDCQALWSTAVFVPDSGG